MRRRRRRREKRAARPRARRWACRRGRVLGAAVLQLPCCRCPTAAAVLFCSAALPLPPALEPRHGTPAVYHPTDPPPPPPPHTHTHTTPGVLSPCSPPQQQQLQPRRRAAAARRKRKEKRRWSLKMTVMLRSCPAMSSGNTVVNKGGMCLVLVRSFAAFEQLPSCECRSPPPSTPPCTRPRSAPAAPCTAPTCLLRCARHVRAPPCPDPHGSVGRHAPPSDRHNIYAIPNSRPTWSLADENIYVWTNEGTSDCMHACVHASASRGRPQAPGTPPPTHTQTASAPPPPPPPRAPL